MIKNVTLGADPELFLIHKNTNKFISSIGLIMGDKNFPMPITDEGHSVLCDNVSVEFTFPPCKTSQDYVKQINFCKEWILGNIPADLTLSDKASAYFDEDQLDDEGAVTFGCSTDHNVYTKKPNTPPNLAVTKNLRVNGGHIHIGWDNPKVSDKLQLIKAMDLYLGLPALLLDNDTERRQMYGKAGCYRDKPYGVEYRTLSNFWIMDDEFIKWAFHNTMKAIEFVNSGSKLSVIEELAVIKAINTCDKTFAAEMVKKFDLPILEYSK